MISFNLLCENEHDFEGWFKDSAAFEKQSEMGFLECPHCGSHAVRKGFNTPNIATGRGREQHDRAARLAEMRKIVANIRKEVETNCENVGDKFAEEARKIHYGETEERGIYGSATREETRDLTEEGIEVVPLPWPDDSKTN